MSTSGKLTKVFSVLNLFRKSKEVVSPTKWKNGQIGVDSLSAVAFAAASTYLAFTGSELQITGEAIDGISAALVTAVPAVVSLFNIIVTVVSNKDVGL